MKKSPIPQYRKPPCPPPKTKLTLKYITNACMIVTRGYPLSYIHRLLTIYNKRTFEPRLIFESFSSLTTGNPESLFVSLFITWVNIEKSRSGNLLESGDKNRWNLPCGGLLLSLICTRSFGKNSLLHLSFKETIFLETCLQNKDNSNSPHGKFHPVSLVYLCFNQMATILWDFPWK